MTKNVKSAPLRLALAALIGAALSGWPDTAEAQCTQMLTTVTCTGNDPDGFAAMPAEDGLDVTVDPGATVENGANPDAILVNDANDVSNEGDITATGAGTAGIRAGDDNDPATAGVTEGIRNRATGTITATGVGARGIVAGDRNRVRTDGQISVDGANAVGIEVGNDSFVEHDRGPTAGSADITIQGDGSIGILGQDGNNLLNDNGTISTTGSVAGATGIQANDGNQLINALLGIITLDGANAVGMRANDMNNIRNSGQMTLTGDGAVGIDANSNNTITNDGSSTPVAIRVTGDDAFGMRLGGSNTASNTALIEVTGARGTGVQIGDDSSFVNDSFVPAGVVRADGVDGVGVDVVGTGGGVPTQVDNRATIIGGTGSGVGVRFSTPNGGILDNQITGSISAASGVAVIGGTGAETVTNRGFIDGNVLLGGGDDSYTQVTNGSFGPGTTSIDGGAGNDAFFLTGGGVNSFDLSTAVNFETLSVSAGAMGLGVWTVTGNGNFPGGASLDAGTMVVGGAVGLNGGFTQQPGTTLSIELRPDGTNDLLAVTGAATINGGTLLLTQSAPLVNAATYSILTATGGLTGNFDTITTPAGGGATQIFTTLFLPNELQVLLTQLPFALVAATENQRRAGAYLDRALAAGPGAEFASVITALQTLGLGPLQASLDQIHPEAYDAHTSAALFTGQRFTRRLAARPEICLREVPPLGRELLQPERACLDHRWHLWGEAFGGLRERDGSGGQIDFDDRSAGTILGAERLLQPGLVVGGSVAGQRTHINVHGIGNGSLTSFDVGVFGGLAQGPLRVRGVAGYGHGWHDQRRNLHIPGLNRTAKSRFQSDRFSSILETGYAIEAGRFTIEPQAALDYQFLRETAAGESGAGALNLEVRSRDTSQVATRFGARVSTPIVKYRYYGQLFELLDGVWTPELRAHWRKVWTGDERVISAFMPGAPSGAGTLRVSAEDASHGLEAGFGLVFQSDDSLVAFAAGYDFLYGDGNLGHQVNANVRLLFY